MSIVHLREGTVCRDCYEVNVEYTTINNGQKRCQECGGVVLTTQEAADYIAELKEELRAMKELYE